MLSLTLAARHARYLVLLAALVVAAAAGPAAAAQGATPTADLEANKALAQRFHEDLFNQGNLAAADEILADDFVWYSPPQTVFLVGPEAVKQQAGDLRADWPDVVITTDEVIAEGDRVVNRWTLRATAYTEDGRAFSIVYTGIDIFRIENGKLAELWQNTDDLGLGQQFAAAAALGDAHGRHADLLTSETPDRADGPGTILARRAVRSTGNRETRPRTPAIRCSRTPTSSPPPVTPVP